MSGYLPSSEEGTVPTLDLDLSVVLDHYSVDYNPGKRSQKILCPVHEEFVPSCSINLDEGWFRCHACDAKGDGYNLIMEKERCGFATAVQIAEEIAATGGGKLRKADEPRRAGLLGRTRPGRRDGAKGKVRVRIYPDSRP
jgi:hypothetical protein